MTDLDVLIECLRAASEQREPELPYDDWSRANALVSKLGVARQNSANERITVELHSSGELVLLTR